jgi:hypothetical protein
MKRSFSIDPNVIGVSGEEGERGRDLRESRLYAL